MLSVTYIVSSVALSLLSRKNYDIYQTYTNKMGVFSSMMNLVRKGDLLKMDGLIFLHAGAIKRAVG